MSLNQALAAPLFGLGEACRLSGDMERAKYYFKMYVNSRADDVTPALVEKAKGFLNAP
jgi:ribosome-binding factor A